MSPLERRIASYVAREPWSTAAELATSLRTTVTTIRSTCTGMVQAGLLLVKVATTIDRCRRRHIVHSYAVAVACPVPATRAARIREMLTERPRTTRELTLALKEPGERVRESLRELRESGGVVGTPAGGRSFLWALACGQPGEKRR